jgi:tetrapyrrole methylase family protein/MazG family protein
MPEEENLDSFAALLRIIARLRGPEGCPWDRAQTHASLKPTLIEECYEAIETIDQEDSEKLCEELGDLLLHITLHAQIAAESGSFDIKDVLRGINNKLIHRHPHVFGGSEVKDAREVTLKWETLKQEERKGASLLSSLPKGMPALAYSQAIQRRVARIGFDWKEIDDIIEEVEELQEATEQQRRVQEFGDLLFTLVNIARRLDIDPEESLRLANEKFYRRFRHMEKICQKRGISLDSLPLEEQDKLWEEAKQTI